MTTTAKATRLGKSQIHGRSSLTAKYVSAHATSAAVSAESAIVPLADQRGLPAYGEVKLDMSVRLDTGLPEGDMLP